MPHATPHGDENMTENTTPTAPAKPRARKPRTPSPLTIVADTREQRPLTDWPDFVAVKRDTLRTGDYSIDGWTECFCVERKSLADFAGTMIGGYEPSAEKPRKRFNRELDRMRHFDRAAILVEATPAEARAYRHNCGMDAHQALWHFALSIEANYGVPVHFVPRDLCAAWIADYARHFVNARTRKNFTREDREEART